MQFAFYLSALVAILATLRVITHTNPVRALLYLIVSLMGVSGVFFSLGAYFAGALEIIVYAGAIMVLFVFVVMMLNLGSAVEKQEREWLQPRAWIGPSLFSLLLFIAIAIGIYGLKGTPSGIEGISGPLIAGTPITPKDVGISLFSSYLLMVELAAIMLLGGLTVVYHIGRIHPATTLETNKNTENAKENA